MRKIRFSEKIILKENIYFLQEKTNRLYFFEEDNTGSFVVDDDNKGKFKWKIEDGFLSLNGNSISEVWSIKQVIKNNNTIIISIHKDESDYHDDDILIWAFIEENDEINNINGNIIDIFKKLNKKHKTIFTLSFLSIFLFLFFIISNLFLIRDMHLLLKLLFIIIIIAMTKDRIFYFLVDFFTNKENK